MKINYKSVLSSFLGIVMSFSVCTASVLHISAAENDKFIKIPVGEVEQPVSTPTVAVEPVIISFASIGAMNSSEIAFYKHGDNMTEGRYKVIADKGVDNSLQLLYCEHASFAPYRVMFGFASANKVNADHKYMRIKYKAVDTAASEITVTANDGSGSAKLVSNTAVSGGNWVVSAPVDVSSVIPRFAKGMHCTFEYKSANPDALFYIKEIAFFGSAEAAYEYYGDGTEAVIGNKSALTFGTSGNAKILSGANYGNFEITGDSVKIMYAESTNIPGFKYMAKAQFNKSVDYDKSCIYVRTLYRAKNPADVPTVDIGWFNDANGKNTTMLVKGAKDTNGEFVLSDTAVLGKGMAERIKSGRHGSLLVNLAVPGGEYEIKALYFFSSEEAANAFTLGDNTALTVNGNDISKYQIVVSSEETKHGNAAAGKLRDQIAALTGVSLKIVDDTAPESEYEIMVGRSARELTSKVLEASQEKKYSSAKAVTSLEGNKLVIVSELAMTLEETVKNFMLTHLYLNMTTAPEKIDLSSDINTDSVVNVMQDFDWGETENVADPVKFADDFSEDNGYWQEENNAGNWFYKDGTYSINAGDNCDISYVHVYEKDVKLTARFKYTEAKKDASVGIVLRYNAKDAYVKAGYDFETGEWYIDSREGLDFYRVRHASVKANLTPDTWYNISVTANEYSAALEINGEKVLETDKLTHATHGRFGFYAENANVSFDDAAAVLFSGNGTVMRDIVHNILPVDSYIEGGSAWEMNDGSLIYEHHSGNTFKSVDSGKSWEKTEKWITPSGYMNVMRLNNGDFMHIVKSGDKWISRTSSDEGKTWAEGGVICATSMGTAGAGNMNDKLFQSATTGRIFYSQNYESKTAIDGRYVFCEFYYTDDNGKTWTKSETDSWEIEGNEKHARFGECKLLECADGTIRMYNSWSDHGYITYADSTDGGKTFGPLKIMSDFPTPRSSMQFVRDPYAENDTTYYMVWVNAENKAEISMNRTRLSIAYSTDGKNWEYLGDIWRWDPDNYISLMFIPQIVDPFVQVTKDYVIVGSGISESYNASSSAPHNDQRQNIWSIKKTSLHSEKLGSFTDVNTADSYYDAVKFVTEKGLFNGTSSTTFEPFTTMTRAMFVTVLGRLDGADMSSYTKTTFADVVAGQWYASYVEWAAANGIVNGLGGGVYGINNTVTVEQALTILYRYSNGKTASVKSDKTVSDFADNANVSSWANDAVKWAVENGIYTGVNGKLDPSQPASRALVAQIFYSYVVALG